MASTQRVQDWVGVTWTVVDDDGRVVGPVEEYVGFTRQLDYSPNTVRSYARSLALWSTHMEHRGRAWDAVVLAAFGSFLQALRAGEVGSDVTAVRPRPSVAAKSSEIPAVRDLLAYFDLTGVVVTLDAMHTQTDTATAITGAGGNYVFTVQGNIPTLHRHLKALLWKQVPAHRVRSTGHRRRSTATVKVVAARPGSGSAAPP